MSHVPPRPFTVKPCEGCDGTGGPSQSCAGCRGTGWYVSSPPIKLTLWQRFLQWFTR